MACPMLDDCAATLALQFFQEGNQMVNMEKGIPPSQAALGCSVDVHGLQKIWHYELSAF